MLNCNKGRNSLIFTFDTFPIFSLTYGRGKCGCGFKWDLQSKSHRVRSKASFLSPSLYRFVFTNIGIISRLRITLFSYGFICNKRDGKLATNPGFGSITEVHKTKDIVSWLKMPSMTPCKTGDKLR